MLNSQLISKLKKYVKGSLIFDAPMKNYTSFKIGGRADIFIQPYNIDDLKNILFIANQNDLPINIIGNGTNLLVSDNGIEGVVIKIGDNFKGVVIDECMIFAESGCSLSNLSRLAADNGLSGLEFAIGIPGTVGGAIVMNAGAHGNSMSDIVTKAKVIDWHGRISELCNEDLLFDYRASSLQGNKAIVLNAEMKLKKDEVNIIKERMSKFIQWRKKNQPINSFNAGSIFKNPKGDFAGRLIDIAGYKGTRIGGAQISELNANFIINLGDANARDVFNLINTIRDGILRKFGVELSLEVKLIGRWGDRGEIPFEYQ